MARRWRGLRLFASGTALATASALFACGPPSVARPKEPERARVILIATERSSRGGRLVGVRADGARQYELTQLPGNQTIIDRSPSVSPDGKIVVFASNRGRADIAATSLYQVPIEGGEPTRLDLGEGAHVDRDPRFSSDGRWLYFCSNRRGSFDLYRVARENGRLGEVELVVASEEQILSPGVSPTGEELVYMAVDAEGQSRLWLTASDGSGEPRKLSEGPMDMTPAWGSDDMIAFASRAPDRDDADLYLIPVRGGERVRVLSTPLTDETGPRFSEDARFIFAIGMYRGSDGKPLLGSVIYVDRKATTPAYRALHDAAGAESRIGLALVPDPLPVAELQRNDPYEEALRKTVLQEWLRNQSERRASEDPSRSETPR